MSPWPLLAGVLALGVAAAAGFATGSRLKQGEWDADVLAREERARNVEVERAAEAAKLRSEKDEQIRRISARLVSALGELRKRPERLPEATRPSCAGATGAELSGPDAGFLVGEAARADELRAALAECQRWISIVKPVNQQEEDGGL